MLRKKRGTLQPPQSSIVLHLKPILKARGIIHPSAYLLKIGINSFTANKMLQGKAVQLNFKQLTTLCTHLNCTPNDLLALRKIDLPTQHALHTLQNLTDEPLPDISKWLQSKTIEEVRELMKNE